MTQPTLPYPDLQAGHWGHQQLLQPSSLSTSKLATPIRYRAPGFPNVVTPPLPLVWLPVMKSPLRTHLSQHPPWRRTKEQ